MPLRTETYDLGEEVQRLEDRIDELEEVLQDVDDADNPAAQRLQNERVALEAHLEGVQWARDGAFEADYVSVWDEDVDEVTLAGLTAGEFGAVEDDIGGTGNGASRVYLVAKGTVDAPYIDEDADEDQQIGAVSQLPLAYTKWAESKVDELTGVGGNEEKSYRELFEEMQPAGSNRT